jgi:hypothetical protein
MNLLLDKVKTIRLELLLAGEPSNLDSRNGQSNLALDMYTGNSKNAGITGVFLLIILMVSLH